jgi:hypothetical protein
MYLDKEKTDYLRGKDLIYPTREDYSRIYVYFRGQVLANITTGNIGEEAVRLDKYFATSGIHTEGTQGLSHNFDKIKIALKKLGMTIETDLDQDALSYAKAEYNRTIGGRIDVFRAELYEYYGVTDNPKADAVYDKAYDRGHSAGLGEVSSIFGDLVELIVD